MAHRLFIALYARCVATITRINVKLNLHNIAKHIKPSTFSQQQAVRRRMAGVWYWRGRRASRGMRMALASREIRNGHSPISII